MILWPPTLIVSSEVVLGDLEVMRVVEAVMEAMESITIPRSSTMAREILMLSSINKIMVVHQTIMTVQMEDVLLRPSINSTIVVHLLSTINVAREMLVIDNIIKSSMTIPQTAPTAIELRASD